MQTIIEAVKRICTSILSTVNANSEKLNKLQKKLNEVYDYYARNPNGEREGRYTYELVHSIALSDGIIDKLIMPDCQADYFFDPYKFESDFDYRPGDIIRRYDNTYHMMMVIVKQRIFANGKIYLVCEKLNPKKEFIFTQGYANECHKYMAEHPEDFVEGKEPEWSPISKMIEELTEHRTTVDYKNICYRTKEIVYTKLGLEYHRPSRWEYEDF